MSKYKKQVFFAFVLALALIIASFIFGVYYYHEKDKDNEKEVVDKALQVEFNDSNEIMVKNILPLSNELAKNMDNTSAEEGTLGYMVFKITNPNSVDVDYEIYVTEKEKIVNPINKSYIKLYLTDDKKKPLEGFDTNLIPSFDELMILSNKADSRLLYQGRLEANKKETLILKSWLADTYTLINQDESYSFSVDARIK